MGALDFIEVFEYGRRRREFNLLRFQNNASGLEEHEEEASIYSFRVVTAASSGELGRMRYSERGRCKNTIMHKATDEGRETTATDWPD